MISRMSFFQNRQLSSQPDVSLAEVSGRAFIKMRASYPRLMTKQFNGKVAYTAQVVKPADMVQQGGFRARGLLWCSNTGSGDNDGSICFSLLPEVAVLFATIKKGPVYLYAFPLHGQFMLPGGPWRQVIAPGAFVLPAWWQARQVTGIDYVSNAVKLGPLSGNRQIEKGVVRGERHESFLSDQLTLPECADEVEDMVPHYEIQDTDLTREFQEAVKAHYAAARLPERSSGPR